ncbi:hypothetical protein [uncultured Vibrio sp.]|uniref:hypothetical protein n=1 Tax=uncultured Vibrio sp. TaxID=114054 RepID=UPI0025CC987A|nr:hypothetical protein [uncultured Vibrio sp.]
MNEVKYYWPIDGQTKEVQLPIEAKFRGGMWHIPNNALLVEPTKGKDGYAVIAILDENGKPTGSRVIEDHRSTAIYHVLNCLEFKSVTELGPIEDGWTLEKPANQYDKWLNDQWVTDEQAKYEAELINVSNTRQALYQTMVDPLNKEAAMIRRVDGDEAKALANEAQADAAYLKIRSENPWPVNPKV